MRETILLYLFMIGMMIVFVAAAWLIVTAAAYEVPEVQRCFSHLTVIDGQTYYVYRPCA